MASFLLLGPLEVRAHGAPVPLRGHRQRVVLALLLLDMGKVVPTDRLITAVWDDTPPSTARAQVQISISKLRAFLTTLDLPDAIVTHESGYLIQVPDDDLDTTRFRRLVAGGRDAARRGDPTEAASALRQALALWRGDALTGLRSRLVRAVALTLDEERLAVTEECIDLELELGHHREVIGELRNLVTGHPFREKLHAQLMLALSRDRRQAEALAVYREARRILVEEHGLDPSEQLRALERAILEADPTAVNAPMAEPEQVRPRQLPARSAVFVGRTDGTQRLIETLAQADGQVVVISGPAGVGKTTLAVEVANQLGDKFPDGQLFARLRRGDNQPAAPDQVLDYFLRSLGVPPVNLPTDREALGGPYRSHLAGKRLLILLDDAAGAWQVEPLLPGDHGVAVIVTSRSALPGLRNAHRFDLDVLPAESSRQLLAEVLGEARVAAEPDSAAAVADACGHLPLALQVAAAKLSARPHWPIFHMASRLGDENRRLDELSLEGAGVRASILISVEALSPPARRLLLLLGSLGATDFGGWVAGPLLDMDVNESHDVLDELIDLQLAVAQVGTGHRARYQLHDLVGVLAREMLPDEVPTGERHAAAHRLLRCWLHLVRQAHRREYGGDFTLLEPGATPWPLFPPVVNDLLADPIGWFESEHTNLVAAVRLAAELHHPVLCSDLAVTLVTFFEARAYREDWRETHEVALEAVVRHAEARAEAVVRCSRAGLALVEQRLGDAESDLTSALSWFERADDAHGRGLALRGLGSVDRLQGRHRRARERYEHALADLRAAGDRVAEAHVLTNLAEVLADQGHRRDAEDLLRQALAICADLGVRRVQAQARCRLGQLYLDDHDLDRAQEEFDAVLRTVTTAADLTGKAYALLGIGAVLTARHQLDQARLTLIEALTAMRQTGSRVGTGRALLSLAELCLTAGEPSAAADWLRTADAAFADIGAARWRDRVNRLRERLPTDDVGSE